MWYDEDIDLEISSRDYKGNEREREILNKVSEWVSGYNFLHYIL